MDFVEWWTQLWAGFASWWPTIDWGNAPSWVGAILTSLSVLVAVVILRSDRSKANLAEVDNFVTRVTVSSRPDKGDTIVELNVYAHNAGAKPIALAVLHYWDDLIWRSKILDATPDDFVIPAQGQGMATVPYKVELEAKNYFIEMADSKNRSWYRELKNNKYISLRKVKRWRKRGRMKPLTHRVN